MTTCVLARDAVGMQQQEVCRYLLQEQLLHVSKLFALDSTFYSHAHREQPFYSERHLKSDRREF